MAQYPPDMAQSIYVLAPAHLSHCQAASAPLVRAHYEAAASPPRTVACTPGGGGSGQTCRPTAAAEAPAPARSAPPSGPRSNAERLQSCAPHCSAARCSATRLPRPRRRDDTHSAAHPTHCGVREVAGETRRRHNALGDGKSDQNRMKNMWSGGKFESLAFMHPSAPAWQP